MVDRRLGMIRTLTLLVVSLAIVSSVGAQTTQRRRQPTGQANQPRAGRAAQRSNQRPAGTAGAPQRAGRRGPVVPDGFPLSEKEQQRVDRILNHWEGNTSDIKTYQAKFIRRNYNYVFGGRKHPKTVDVGTLRYRKPDKGLMRVDKIYDVNPEATDPAQQYVEKKDVEFGEYWVCDGDSIFQFDSRTKTLTETKLPPEMQGKTIGDGPLPFMFGAKAEKMKARYWIREIIPAHNPNQDYFLEATPKRQKDAANFEKVLVKLSRSGKYLLPSALRVDNKQGRIDYELSEHTPNAPHHRLASFLNSFVRPKTPRGWTKVTEQWNGTPVEQADRDSAKRPSQQR